MEHLAEVLVILVVGCIGTALTRIWKAQNRLEDKVDLNSNRLTKLEAAVFKNGVK